MGPVRTDDSGGARGGWKWGDGGLAVLPWPLLQLLPEELVKAKHYVRVPKQGGREAGRDGQCPTPRPCAGLGCPGRSRKQAGWPSGVSGDSAQEWVEGEKETIFFLIFF